MNRGEGGRHRFAAQLLSRLGRRVVVPWPILTEADLFLRSRGHPVAPLVFADALIAEVHRLEAPTNGELARALEFGRRYLDAGVDLTDLLVMTMAEARGAQILTWDFRHFRSVVPRRGRHWPLLVEEHELPDP